MATTKTKAKKPIPDKGKNVRLSTAGYDRIKAYVDSKGFWNLGPFVEKCVLETIEKDKSK